jgi:hypothetical protein
MIDLLKEFRPALAHDHQAIRQARHLCQNPALVRVGFAQNRVQRRDDGHAQITEQSQDVTASPPAEDAIFELQADEIHAVDIQEVRSAPIGLDIFLSQFEANASRIGVAAFDVVDRHGDARSVTVFGGNGLA